MGQGEGYVRRHPKASPAPTIFGRDLFGRRLGLCAALLALAMLAFGATVARAESRYAQTGQFGTGQFGDQATAIATEEATGRVFVVDRESNRVVVFESADPGAGVLTTFGAGELSEPYGIAIDQGNGDIYVSDAGNNRVVRYESDGATPPTYHLDAGYASPAQGAGAGEIGDFASHLAVDPANGDLLVADVGNKRVDRYDATGAFVNSFDGSTSPNGAFTSLIDVSAGEDGSVYVVANGIIEPQIEAMYGAVVESFQSDGSFEREFGPPGSLEDARAVAFEGKSGRLLVLSGGGGPPHRLRVFEAQTEVGSAEITAGSSTWGIPTDISTGNTGKGPIAVLEAKDFYGEGVAEVEVLRSIAIPTAVIAPAGPNTATTATLNGTVDTGGEAGVVFHFEFRIPPRSIYEDPPWQSTPDQSAPSGSGPQAVAAEITELLPNQRYEAKLVASSLGGSSASSAAEFKTASAPPRVKTEGATGITDSGATLNGSVNPEGTPTTFYFEYGTGAGYGAKLPVAGGSLGAGRGTQNLSRNVSGLVTGLTYHFRIVAENSAGRSFGEDRVLVPLPALPNGRAYEQVTPVEKYGSIPVALQSMHSFAGGDTVAYVVRAADSPGLASNPYKARLVSNRTASGWSEWSSADAALGVNGEVPQFTSTLGMSEDGKHAFVASTRALTPEAFSTELATNLYVKNLETGTYRFVGGTEKKNAFGQFSIGPGAEGTFQAAANDMSWVVFFSTASLLPNVPLEEFYRWSDTSGLEVISKLPDGSIPPEAYNPAQAASFAIRNVSDGGKRIFFNFGTSPVYLWEAGHTRAVSISKLDEQPKNAIAMGSSANGRYVVVSSPSRLTSATPETSREKLYRVDVDTGDVEFIGVVRSVGSAVRTLSGMEGMSANAERIYFAAPEENNAENQGEIVLWENGETRVVDTFGAGRLTPSATNSDGRYFVYEKDGDIYLYDAKYGSLKCVSCRGGETTGDAVFPSTIGAGQQAEFDRRFSSPISESGEVFFTSTASLLPQDKNGVADVYAYQGGQLSLISPGDRPYPAILGDVSPSGRDVFFTSGQGLVAQDVDGKVDVYDARLGGGIPSQNESPVRPCQGEACQGRAAENTPGASVGSEAPGNQAAPKRRQKTKHPKHKNAKGHCGKRKCSKKSVKPPKKGAKTGRHK